MHLDFVTYGPFTLSPTIPPRHTCKIFYRGHKLLYHSWLHHFDYITLDWFATADKTQIVLGGWQWAETRLQIAREWASWGQYKELSTYLKDLKHAVSWTNVRHIHLYYVVPKMRQLYRAADSYIYSHQQWMDIARRKWSQMVELYYVRISDLYLSKSRGLAWSWTTRWNADVRLARLGCEIIGRYSIKSQFNWQLHRTNWSMMMIIE